MSNKPSGLNGRPHASKTNPGRTGRRSSTKQSEYMKQLRKKDPDAGTRGMFHSLARFLGINRRTTNK